MIYKDICYNKSHPSLTLDFYVPDNADACPLYIFFHGGGLNSGSKEDDLPLFEALNQRGIAVVSADYRVYPQAKFPEFIEDCASAVSFAMSPPKSYGNFTDVFIGGSSAGAYIAMMLCFDRTYLQSRGVDESRIKGFLFDAGQPTTHYHILENRGEDPRRVVVDSAAPIYHIDRDFNIFRNILIIVASNDFVCRLEQNRMLERTLINFSYPSEKIKFKVMEGYEHCGYTKEKEYFKLTGDFILDFNSINKYYK